MNFRTFRENKMENKIKLVRGKIEEVTLNEPMVDVLVSEWMGYFLLFEGMLDSVIHARNKYLAPDGLMLPNSCSISMMAIGDSGRHSYGLSLKRL
jgi:protein arginine N-methyltransferase 3